MLVLGLGVKGAVSPIFSITVKNKKRSVSMKSKNHGPVRLKVIPQYCIAHPYCARFLASLETLTTWRFLYETKPAREIKGHFLLNEHGDLSFFLHNFDEIIIFFELNVVEKNMYKITIRRRKFVKLRSSTRGTHRCA